MNAERHFTARTITGAICGCTPIRYTTEDYRLVTCKNCRRTKAFRARVKELARQAEITRQVREDKVW